MAVSLADVAVVQAETNPLLEPSPGLMVWTLVTFGLTLFILKKFVFGPIGEALEKRRVDIARSIEEAEHSRDESQRLLEDYKVRLAEAQKEADQLREQGRKAGERQGAQLVSAAQQQSERVLADGQTQMDAQVRQAASDLRDQVVDLALSAAGKVSGKTLTDVDHRRLIEEAIDKADLASVGRN